MFTLTNRPTFMSQLVGPCGKSPDVPEEISPLFLTPYTLVIKKCILQLLYVLSNDKKVRA